DFDKGSNGTVAAIIYEFKDFAKLGKETKERDVFGFALKTYVCTTQAMAQKLCEEKDLGKFIVDESKGPTPSILNQRIDFGTDGQPKTISYPVNQTGYYCLGATVVPLTSLPVDSNTKANIHAAFKGRVTFNNSFKGNLPAAEYPKLSFYFYLTAVYAILGLFWFYLCVKHRDQLLTVQHFISGTIIFLIVEMAFQWLYYWYLNSHLIDFFRIQSVEHQASETAAARFLLVMTSILDATRNSLSFFLLLIVSMGYGVIRPSIGPVMTRIRILTAGHFVFGVLYSVGIVLIQIDQGGAWVLFFIFPLAITLTTFLTWIMHSLNHSIDHLTARKQTFKKMMFTKLYRILLGAVIVIFLFFVISSIAFSQSGGEGFSPKTWAYRWFLLDGWLGSLYLAVFSAIAWVWRPTGNNMRLAMSDELATDDDPDAEGFEVDTFSPFTRDEDDDDEAKPSSAGQNRAVRPGPRSAGVGGGATARAGQTAMPERRSVGEDDVVFEIGDDEDDGVRAGRGGAQGERGTAGERQGLMSLDDGEEDGNESKETLVPGRMEGGKDKKED
ncbi:hypothetical protein IE53DRAFT_370721, partial [Violaceomyces palustris]